MLETPARGRALSPKDSRTRREAGLTPLRRDMAEDFGAERLRRASDRDEDGADIPATLKQKRGLRLRLGRSVPESVVGRVVAGGGVLVLVGIVIFGLVTARAAMLHDARLTVPSSRAIQISGNNHLTRAQLLSVFGGDVDRNILTVPLAARRAELEKLPWVDHATVMRLLPNTVRVAITERTPVAFVRQGGSIGLVDAHGVLLDLAPEVAADHAYSFPVVTGLSETDPLDTRAARMKVYSRFTGELDSGSDKVSRRLSEIDLTDPEDVKALIPDNGTDVLVHFGDDDFLSRYQRFMQNLPDWRGKYPKLASADMRYDREVVLEMTPGSAVPIARAAPAALNPPATPAKKLPAVVKKAATRGFATGKPVATTKWHKQPVVSSAHKSVKAGHRVPGRGPR